MTSKEKKAMKFQQIKLGLTSPKQRAKVWEYILHNDLGVGYYNAQQLAQKGIRVLKVREYDEDRVD